jgi:hypothetical protein
MEDYIGESAAKGWVHPFAPYRDVHAQNLKLVHDYWRARPLPELGRGRGLRKIDTPPS